MEPSGGPGLMADLSIRTEGRAGRITLTRPQALNALTWEMCRQIDAALKAWAVDPAVALVLIDAEGARAFCAGGDVAEVHAAGRRHDFAYAQHFWADEYRMNARIAEYPKPVVSFLQGFTMGGGVGLGCHASHRIVGSASRVAMPECAIGLAPDVGGSCLLARAPGRLGCYFGMTGARMGPGDAILMGFADCCLPESDWPALKARLIASGDVSAMGQAARPAPEAATAAHRDAIDRLFAAPDAVGVVAALQAEGTEFALDTLRMIARNSPLAVAAAREMQARLSPLPLPRLRDALALEYRFTFRALGRSDFLEGIRALIIDKDRRPRWRHGSVADVNAAEVTAMLAELGPDELDFGAAR